MMVNDIELSERLGRMKALCPKNPLTAESLLARYSDRGPERARRRRMRLVWSSSAIFAVAIAAGCGVAIWKLAAPSPVRSGATVLGYRHIEENPSGPASPSVTLFSDYPSFKGEWESLGAPDDLLKYDAAFFDGGGCLYSVSFYADADETWAGDGVVLEKAEASGESPEELVFTISVPSAYFDEGWNELTFFASDTQSGAGKFSHYSLSVYQRDTGKKGSCYYDESGTLR